MHALPILDIPAIVLPLDWIHNRRSWPETDSYNVTTSSSLSWGRWVYKILISKKHHCRCSCFQYGLRAILRNSWKFRIAVAVRSDDTVGPSKLHTQVKIHLSLTFMALRARVFLTQSFDPCWNTSAWVCWPGDSHRRCIGKIYKGTVVEFLAQFLNDLIFFLFVHRTMFLDDLLVRNDDLN